MEALPNEIMTVSDVAEYFRIPISSVYKLAQEGKIPAHKIGRHWRFHRDTIIKWITTNNFEYTGIQHELKVR